MQGYTLIAYGGTINLYGKFHGVRRGQIKTLPSSYSAKVPLSSSNAKDPLSGSKGSFTGTLRNSAASQTFKYVNNSTIRLHDVAWSPPRSRRSSSPVP